MRIDSLENIINSRKSSGLYRSRPMFNAKLNFSSNDYLSLSADKRIKKAYINGYELYNVGSGGSPYICGYHPIHQELEESFATALKVDDCLLFSSGYAANISVMQLLSQLSVPLLLDKSVHASIYDGIAMNSVNYKRYLHNNIADAHKKLSALDNGVLITESLFSMSGELSQLDKLQRLCSNQGFSMVVDEAHAFGIYGPQGLGLVAEKKLSQEDIPMRIITFGKTLNGNGAVVAGDRVWIEALVQVARSAIYSTAISPAQTYGVLKTFELLQEEDNRRKMLFEVVGYFKNLVQFSPLKWRDSDSPIQLLQLGCPERAMAISAALRLLGIFCMPVRSPTVSIQDTGLRITLNAMHTEKDINFLLENIHQLCASI